MFLQLTESSSSKSSHNPLFIEFLFKSAENSKIHCTHFARYGDLFLKIRFKSVDTQHKEKLADSCFLLSNQNYTCTYKRISAQVVVRIETL